MVLGEVLIDLHVCVLGSAPSNHPPVGPIRRTDQSEKEKRRNDRPMLGVPDAVVGVVHHSCK